jgi:hypothetical protein
MLVCDIIKGAEQVVASGDVHILWATWNLKMRHTDQGNRKNNINNSAPCLSTVTSDLDGIQIKFYQVSRK